MRTSFFFERRVEIFDRKVGLIFNLANGILCQIRDGGLVYPSLPQKGSLTGQVLSSESWRLSCDEILPYRAHFYRTALTAVRRLAGLDTPLRSAPCSGSLTAA